jgi:hypothetical protein
MAASASMNTLLPSGANTVPVKVTLPEAGLAFLQHKGCGSDGPVVSVANASAKVDVAQRDVGAGGLAAISASGHAGGSVDAEPLDHASVASRGYEVEVYSIACDLVSYELYSSCAAHQGAQEQCQHRMHPAK